MKKRAIVGGPLNEKDREAIEYIRGYFRENGVSPMYPDLQVGLGYSSGGMVQIRLNSLRRKGYARWETGKSRSLELTDGSLRLGVVVPMARFRWKKEVLA